MPDVDGGGGEAAGGIEEPGNFSVVAERPEPEEDVEEEGLETGPEDIFEDDEEGEAPEDEEERPGLTPEEIDALEMTYKVDGEDVTKTVAELKKDAELREASYKRFEAAAEKEKAFKGAIAGLRGASPSQIGAFLERLGHDPVKIAAGIGEMFLRRKDMTPEQREMEDFRREKAEWEARQQAAAEQAKQQRIQARIPVEQERIYGEYMATMDEMGVPEAETLRQNLVQRVAGRQLQARQAGYDLPAADALRMEWDSVQAAAGIQADLMRQERLKQTPPVQRIGKGPDQRPRKARKAPSLRTYASGDPDAFAALLDD